jgi:hypothetical protein
LHQPIVFLTRARHDAGHSTKLKGSRSRAIDANQPCAGTRRRNNKITSNRVHQIEQLNRDRRNVRGGQAVHAGRAPIFQIESGRKVFSRARAGNMSQRRRQHCDASRGWNETGSGIRVLIAAKEEESIFHDGSAEREAGFIASRLGPRDAFLVEEEIVCIELFVLKIVVSAAVKSIPALLCNELEVAAA